MPAAPTALHIALAFDERFWAPAYATMRGICLSTHRRADLVFHLCHPALSAQAIADLGRIGAEFGATLVHHDIDSLADYAHFAKSLPHTRYISEVMYARLFFDRIVGAEVERLAYIDSDILVRWPIEDFLSQDLEGRALGAIKEPHALVCSNRRDGNQDRDLFDPADPYFNSGVLLMDLAKWRDMDIAGRLYALEKEGTLVRLYNDQQILNYLFKNNWTQLDRGWNTLASSTAIEGLDPKAVHYTGVVKPWHLVTVLPFRRIYRHVMTNDFFYRYMRQRWRWYWQDLGRRLTGRV
jgi:lipopolysaccharide biosynthesis glycosyltransferase